MVMYTCKKCQKKFTKKYNYECHLNRKTSCSKKTKHTCKYCEKSFATKHTLVQHGKICKIKIYKNKIKKNNNEINIGGDMINSKNIINNNTINNPIIITFAKDGIDNLSFLDFIDIIGSNKNMYEAIVENVNLNPNKPQHHNIYYKDTKSTYGEVYQGNTWKTKKIDEILETILDAKKEDLTEILKKINGMFKKKIIQKIKDTIENTDYDKPRARARLKSYLKAILYSNKDMIKKTKKLSDDRCD